MPDPLKFSRREMIRLAALGATSAFLAACARAIDQVSAPTKVAIPVATPTQTIIDNVPITPTDDFYVTSAFRTPEIPVDWKLTVAGLISKPLTLSLDEIKAMPSVTEMRTLSCISNPVGGDLISNGVWKGIRLRDLLKQAGVQIKARTLKLESFDGWSTGIPLELGMHEHALLVYELNGAPLPRDHGAPLRCLFPGRYGMKQPKWIKTITLIEQDYAGFWEKQGWSDLAAVLPFSRIDTPPDLQTIDTQPVIASGIAFSNEAGIAKLEISWNDTNVWQPADLMRGPSPYAWAIWIWKGNAPGTGRHQLWARVTDKFGNQQTRPQTGMLIGDTFPHGSDAMHSIILDFK